jgi:rod shape-determining protein MreD
MVDPVATHRLSYRILFIAIVLGIFFLRLLPLSTVPSRWPQPDILLCLTFAWLLRRPDYVPVIAVAAIFFIDDIFTLRPLGLHSAIVLAATEFIRSRDVVLRDAPLMIEWLVVGIVFTAITLSNWLILFLFVIDQPPLGQLLAETLTTLLAYPLVILASVHLARVRKAAMGQVDALGHRL